MRLSYTPYRLIFKEPAGTSRGVLRSKLTYILKLTDDSGAMGVGEAALFEGLSPEAGDEYESVLKDLQEAVSQGCELNLSRYSSIQFGLDQAIANLKSGTEGIYFPSKFTQGKSSIIINGLVWMGQFEEMIRRIDEKVKAGFHCIKLKIGAIDWEHELEMIRHIRGKYSDRDLTVRVDANGAFAPDNVMDRLEALSKYKIHSIEQPIRSGQWGEMAKVCRESPIPVALDEELIGVYGHESKKELLEELRPAYIVLKPALCGGFQGADEWIELAEQMNIGWWPTSALESNIGLNAIAQWAATKNCPIPQGLGTGQLYTNNFPSFLTLEGEHLRFDTEWRRHMKK